MLHFDASFNSSLFVAFLMGFFTSLHCLGMCGSIVGALTLSLKKEIRENKRLLFFYVLSYNTGRVLSYAMAGYLAGLLHQALTMPFGDGAGHRFLQVLSGFIMLGAGLYIAGWFPRFAYIEKAGGLIWRWIEPSGRKLIPVETLPRALVFGMVWGWMPCGLVYTALALSATTGDTFRSAMTMAFFGLGTVPAVLSVGVMTSLLVRISSLGAFRQMAGCTLIALALLAVAPGLNPLVHHAVVHDLTP